MTAPVVVDAQAPGNKKKDKTAAEAGIVVSVSVFSSAEKKALSVLR